VVRYRCIFGGEMIVRVGGICRGRVGGWCRGYGDWVWGRVGFEFDERGWVGDNDRCRSDEHATCREHAVESVGASTGICCSRNCAAGRGAMEMNYKNTVWARRAEVHVDAVDAWVQRRA
jgi:hypothetical protein